MPRKRVYGTIRKCKPSTSGNGFDGEIKPKVRNPIIKFEQCRHEFKIGDKVTYISPIYERTLPRAKDVEPVLCVFCPEKIDSTSEFKKELLILICPACGKYKINCYVVDEIQERNDFYSKRKKVAKFIQEHNEKYHNGLDIEIVYQRNLNIEEHKYSFEYIISL